MRHILDEPNCKFADETVAGILYVCCMFVIIIIRLFSAAVKRCYQNILRVRAVKKTTLKSNQKVENTDPADKE